MRIGILGASTFAPTTLINPARGNDAVVVTAVGARDLSSAQAFAAKYGIAHAHGSYEALIADPDLDAVYVLLPTSLHGRWTRAALAAGKHVLCEKPFTANAAEAREIAELAARSDRVVMEAIQYRYHPLTSRVEQVIASGELGKLKSVDIALCVLLPNFSGNCYNYDFAGGALMDAGSYAVNMARTFGGSTPKLLRHKRNCATLGWTGPWRPSCGLQAGTGVGSAAHCGRPICFGRGPEWWVIAASCVCSVQRHRISSLGSRSVRPAESV